VRKPGSGVLNETQSELQQASCCPFCERFFAVSGEEDGEAREEGKYNHPIMHKFIVIIREKGNHRVIFWTLAWDFNLLK
jgi:hypothetical protein